MTATGKRGGSRRSARPRAGLGPDVLFLASGITLAVVAWGYLVYTAIDFGAQARGGESTAWWFLALASVGAVACLFGALMLVARLARALGLVRPPGGGPPAAGGGGHRAA
ncbi:MAG: hypothetical protein R2731_05600 [Nocardioides sp.]